MSEIYNPPFHMTDEITSLLIEIGEWLGTVSAHAGLDRNPKLRRENRIRSIYSSLAIEQNTLSLDQVTDVIDGRRVLGPPREIREVQNAYDAYEHVSMMNPESQEGLLRTHRMMMQDLTPDAGCYRSGNVGVFDGDRLIHAGTPAAYVPEVMAQLFAWLQQTDMHPLIKSCIFHYEFEFIHPFSDGNGRTGRLWHSLILQRWKPIFAWLPIENMIHEHQADYYQALNEANTTGESTVFVSFMLKIILKTLQEIAETQNRHVGTNVGTNVGRNEQMVLDLLREFPSITAKALAEKTGLSARHVERILASLKKQGKIIRHGATKNGYWEINEVIM